MRRTEAKTRRTRTHRARPDCESLEGRQLLSAGASHSAAASSGGTFSANGRVFRYVTPTGGIATIRIVGVGGLTGTSVDSSGALNIIYGGTNAYSKIVGSVSGGSGLATLGSIRNKQLIAAGQPDSLSGVGGTPLAAVLMSPFDLEPGGSIILTPGVTSLVLHSIGANTNVQLRTLPPAPSYRILPDNPGNTAGGHSELFGVVRTTVSPGTGGSAVLLPVAGGVPAGGLSPVTTIVGTVLIPAVTGNTVLSTGTPLGTLEAGQTAAITSAQGVTLSYASDGGRDQILTNVSGSFTAQPNLLEPLDPGQPATEPPAPPGVIIKAHSFGGSATVVNPLTDSKIFGYDPTTGELIRFDLNLKSDTGAVDPTFAPISVPGKPAVAGVNIAQDGDQLVVLVTSGTTVYTYDAQTGAPVGSFKTAVAVDAVATAGNITVLGSTQLNEMHMIDLPASLKTGMAQGLDSTQPFVPQPGVYGVGGVTGVAGSNNLYAAIGAHFSTLQPADYQLGIGAVGTIMVSASPQGSKVFDEFSVIARTPLRTGGNYTTIDVNSAPPDQIGRALGAVDQNLALDTGVSGGNNVLRLLAPSTLANRGTINLAYPNLLAALSQSFRTNLGSAAVINVQGDVQSIRGRSAHGLFFNDIGNLATIKIQRVANSTFVGQPISHIRVPSRSNVTFLTSAREVVNRNGATQVSNIQPIGPVTPITS